MIQRDSLVSFLNEYLEVGSIGDYSWNGLQVEGTAQVEKVVCAVDSGIETFAAGRDAGADFIIVHHGLFWKKNDPRIIGWAKKRIEILLKNDLSLYACHLPLDRHVVVGNNARLLAILDATITAPFSPMEGNNIGWIGEVKESRSFESIVGRLEKALLSKCTSLAFGRRDIRTIAAVSGGGGMGCFNDALAAGVDCYITGEETEVYHIAKDAGMNVIFAGHHASETVGVKALADIVKKECKVEAEFIDIPTGL
ncbi:MAG: Nif3-like dinuclear metal center hexameric protein [Chitinivibrionales bacterium]|nr:Nif3-like dinuclear metal center hexameric protein [Chitinivibrionales bacterium]